MMAMQQQAIVTMHYRSSLLTRSLAGLGFIFTASSIHAGDLATLKLHGKWVQPINAKMGHFQQTGHPTVCTEKWTVFGAPAATEMPGKLGAAQVFNTATGAWVRKLLPPVTAPANPGFGSSCAVIGNVALIGAPDWGNAGAGAVHVFDLTNGKLLRTLIAADGAAGDHFGSSIAVEGTRAVIGAWGDESNRGSVYVFDFVKGQQLGKLSHTNGMASDFLGVSCAIEGSLVLVGAPGVDGAKGAAFLFDLGTMTQIVKYQLANAAAGSFGGWQVALHHNFAIQSLPSANAQQGKIYVRHLATSTERVLTASDGAAGDQLGLSMAVSGGVIVAGGPLHDSDRGQVYVYDLNSVSTVEFRKVVAADAAPGNNFGMSLALHGGIMAVGTPNDDTQASNTGAGYLLRTLTKPMPLTKVTAKGDYAPGVVDANFNLFSDVGINRQDQLAIASTLSGPGSNSGKDSGVWTSVGMSKTLDLALKSRAEDGGAMVDSVAQALTNFDTRAVFRAKLKGLGVTALNNQAIYTDNGTAVSRTFRTGTFMAQFPTVGAGAGAVPSAITQLSQSRFDPLIGFTCVLQQGVNGTSSASDTGLVLHDFDTTSFKAVREGTAAGATGLTYGQFTGRLSYFDEYAVYSAAVAGVPGNNAAIFAKTFADAEVKVVRKGDTPTGHDGVVIPGLFFSGLIGESMDDQDRVAYRAMISGPSITSANNEGIWSWQGGSSKLIFRKGQDLGSTVTGFKGIDALAGIKIAKFIAFWPTWSQLMALVQLNGPGVTAANDQALLLFEDIGAGNKLRLLMREGQVAPGCGAAVIGTINRVEVEAFYGNYLVLATLKGAPAGTELTLFQGCGHSFMDGRRDPMAMLRKGQLFENQPGRLKTLALPMNNIGASGAGVLGLRNAISEQNGSTLGQVVLPIEFENGVRQIMVGTL